VLVFGHLGFTTGIFSLIEEKLGYRIDYRVVFIGALLPDMIDKPLGMILLPLHNGRVFAHTLLFALMLLSLSLKRSEFSILSIAVLLHLAEDEMWLEPGTLLYPIYGMFPEREFASFPEYVARMISEYTHLSNTLLFEIAGIAILLLFILRKMGRL